MEGKRTMKINFSRLVLIENLWKCRHFKIYSLYKEVKEVGKEFMKNLLGSICFLFSFLFYFLSFPPFSFPLPFPYSFQNPNGTIELIQLLGIKA